MQLAPPQPGSPLRRKLNAAACLLLAASGPAMAQTDAATANWQLDASTLLYSERGRAQVVEPIARITRLFRSGQTISAQLGLDAITGASPTGAVPASGIQTTTTPSGNVRTTTAGQIPVSPFRDLRTSFDLDWLRPLGNGFSAESGGHYSKEKDYRSVGFNEKLSVELMDRLTTVSVGAGFNRDAIFPTGGMSQGLSDPSLREPGVTASKRVSSVSLGLSRVLTRRLLLGVDATRTLERGYLTEPYKVLSVVDETGAPVGQMTEKRPSARSRSDVLGSAVYHLDTDVAYASYRFYWDDWGIRSSTIDLKYRHELPYDHYIQPHVRFYTQSAADFFTNSLASRAPIPAFASSDYRLGPLATITVGATYGFHIPRYPGEFALRGEYMIQRGPFRGFGVGGEGGGGEHEGGEGEGLAQRAGAAGPIADQTPLGLKTPLRIGSLMLTYTVRF